MQSGAKLDLHGIRIGRLPPGPASMVEKSRSLQTFEKALLDPFFIRTIRETKAVQQSQGSLEKFPCRVEPQPAAGRTLSISVMGRLQSMAMANPAPDSNRSTRTTSPSLSSRTGRRIRAPCTSMIKLT